MRSHAFRVRALAVSAYALSVEAATAAAVIGGGSIAMVVAAFLGRRLLKSDKGDGED